MDHKNDLPLMSNSKDFLVYHFVLDLTCDFHTQQMLGDITLFLSTKGGDNTSQIFSIQEYRSAVDPARCSTPEDPLVEELVSSNEQFEFVLDCCDLEILEVTEVISLRGWKLAQNRSALHPNVQFCEGERFEHLTENALNFTVEKWCVRIRKADASKAKFPSVIRIKYKTKAIGASLRWVHDQDKK